MDTKEAWALLERVRDSALHEPVANQQEALTLALLDLRDAVQQTGSHPNLA